MENKPKSENDKPIRLLNYLEELTRLRTKTVKDIDSYHKVLWLKEIPQDSKYCFTRAWGSTDDIDSDIWVQIKKYDEPVLEDVPEECEDWVNNAKLYDASTEPALYETIHVEIEEENPDWTEEDPEEDKIRTVNRTLNLQDHSNVLNTWNEFVREKWTPWAELHKKWETVQDVYSKLFSIHQDQLKLGEEYELVLGLGFLKWETEKGHYSKRHLIVANANLDF
ncbi:MAG: AAA family ATPase, partial [Candidatus Heimdallarchaeota archaeon]|nr:AAA family ATPase [Candidatus Heimdallarchaeota archaeon]